MSRAWLKELNLVSSTRGHPKAARVELRSSHVQTKSATGNLEPFREHLRVAAGAAHPSAELGIVELPV